MRLRIFTTDYWLVVSSILGICTYISIYQVLCGLLHEGIISKRILIQWHVYGQVPEPEIPEFAGRPLFLVAGGNRNAGTPFAILPFFAEM
jgi:hypothetical protein